MLPLRLETHRFTSGFRLESPVGSGKLDASRLAADDAAPDVFLRADPATSEPLVLETVDLETPLFLRFINCKTDGDFIKFADRFWDEHQIERWEFQSKALLLNQTGAEWTIGEYAQKEPALALINANRLLEHTRLRPTIRQIDGASRLVLIATSTADFMAMEIATAVEAGAKMAQCAHCGRYFLFGPLTGRRSHGRYCADRCRVAAMRARNAASKEPEP